MRFKLWMVPAVALLSLVAMAACFDETNIFGPSQSQGQNTGGGASASPAPPAASCNLTTTSVHVSLRGGGSATLAVGESVTLDATPFSGTVRIPDQCNEGKAVTWRIDGPCSLVADVGGFTPQLRADAEGQCIANATVDGVASQAGLVLRVVT